MTALQKQCLLRFLGYDTGGVDGIWGSRSQAAAGEFLKKAGEQDLEKALLQAVSRWQPGIRWQDVRYWQREEFRCRCGGQFCDGFPAEPDPVLVALADDLRSRAGRPAIASSGLRCRQHNAAVGGVEGSRHLSGKALDFSVPGMTGERLLALAQADSRTRYAYIIEGGWVHIDVE